MPLVGDTTELVDATVGEAEAGSGDEVLHRGRGDDLSGACHRADPLRDVDGDTADVAAAYLNFPGMQASPDVDSQIGHGVPERRRASHGPRRPVERGQDAVPGELHHSAPEAPDLPP